MDMLKSMAGSGDKAADEKKAAAAAAGPGFVENVKTGAANAHTAATEGVNKGVAAASDLVVQAKEYLNKPAETKPEPKKTEAGAGVGGYVKKAQDFVTGGGEKK